MRICDSKKLAGSEPAVSPDAGAPELAGGQPTSSTSSDKKETGALPPPRRSETRSSPRETSLAPRTGGRGPCHGLLVSRRRRVNLGCGSSARPGLPEAPHLDALRKLPTSPATGPAGVPDLRSPGPCVAGDKTKGEAPSTPGTTEISDSSSSSPELSSPARAQNRDPHPDQVAQGGASEDEPTLDRELQLASDEPPSSAPLATERTGPESANRPPIPSAAGEPPHLSTTHGRGAKVSLRRRRPSGGRTASPARHSHISQSTECSYVYLLCVSFDFLYLLFRPYIYTRGTVVASWDPYVASNSCC
jgi:hypothetical protein